MLALIEILIFVDVFCLAKFSNNNFLGMEKVCRECLSAKTSVDSIFSSQSDLLKRKEKERKEKNLIRQIHSQKEKIIALLEEKIETTWGTSEVEDQYILERDQLLDELTNIDHPQEILNTEARVVFLEEKKEFFLQQDKIANGDIFAHKLLKEHCTLIDLELQKLQMDHFSTIKSSKREHQREEERQKLDSLQSKIEIQVKEFEKQNKLMNNKKQERQKLQLLINDMEKQNKELQKLKEEEFKKYKKLRNDREQEKQKIQSLVNDMEKYSKEQDKKIQEEQKKSELLLETIEQGKKRIKQSKETVKKNKERSSKTYSQLDSVKKQEQKELQEFQNKIKSRIKEDRKKIEVLEELRTEQKSKEEIQKAVKEKLKSSMKYKDIIHLNQSIHWKVDSNEQIAIDILNADFLYGKLCMEKRFNTNHGVFYWFFKQYYLRVVSPWRLFQLKKILNNLNVLSNRKTLKTKVKKNIAEKTWRKEQDLIKKLLFLRSRTLTGLHKQIDVTMEDLQYSYIDLMNNIGVIKDLTSFA